MEHLKREDTKHVPRPFQCTICPKSFVKEAFLQEHILIRHVEDKEFQCIECFKTKQLTKYFATQEILNKHRKRVHGPPRFKCQVCFRAFTDSSNLARHKRSHSQADSNRHKCDLCSKAYPFKYMLQRHSISVHRSKREGAPKFKCELCSQEFMSRSYLEYHVVTNHVVDKAFECSVCSKTFIDQEALEKHMKRHDKQIEHFCDVCSQGFKVKKSLAKHIGVKHEKFFYCDKCLRSFKNKPEFDEHFSESKQKLKCYICQKIISSQCNLKIHTNSHVKKIKTEKNKIKVENQIQRKETDITPKPKSTHDLKNSKNFHCQLCSKTFDRVAYLRAHRTLLHPNAKWNCNFKECCKSFNTCGQLRQHRVMHAEPQEFNCNICQKSFQRPDSFKVHQQMHVKEKKFKCEMCPKTCATSTQLRTHIANKHGGFKPFKCPFANCETSWATNDLFKNHLATHETEKSFICKMCTVFKAFKCLRYLKIHQSGVHSDTKKIKAVKSQSTRHLNEVVFICSATTCFFETMSETEVALHYSQQHQLPRVLILDCLSSSPFPLVSEKISNQKINRMIRRRYKCKICSKLFKSASPFSMHGFTHSNETLPFKCSRCPKSFRYNRNLNRHILEKHS